VSIPYGRQNINEEDIKAVTEVLRGDWLTQGPTIERFEKAVAEYVGAQHAVAFSSGSAALHGAAWASGLGPGDVAYTSPLTFMATPNAARYVGATPALVDVSADSWNLNLSLLPEDADAVFPVHYAGLPVNLAEPGRSRRPRVVIEDAAHALGAHTAEGPVGNCRHSDMTCFSFHPVKPITTGEGGMVTTNNSELADRLRRFRTHGIVKKPEKGGWYYEISELGHHYRMTDIQAALGFSQLARLDEFISSRNQIAQAYREQLSGLNIELPPEPLNGYVHGYHLFAVLVPRRAEVFSELQQRGIKVQVHYVPVHHHPISKDLGNVHSGYPIADGVYSRLLSLPIFPGMPDNAIKQVAANLEELIGA